MATTIKCDYCGGNNIFDPRQGKLVCEHCGNVSECGGQEPLKPLTQKYSSTYTPEPNYHNENHYVCISCGAEVSFEENEDKKRCPSCGDASLERKNAPTVVPDAIIPFSIDREKAVELFRKWISTRKFAPRDLKEMAKLGKISGLYVPAWNVSFTLAGSYFANVTKVDSSGDEIVSWHYPIRDSLEKTYFNILISGNNRLGDEVIDSLSPYDIQKMRPYSSEYVYGFSGLGTDVNLHEKYDEVLSVKKEKMADTVRDELNTKFNTIESLNMNYTTKNSKFSYLYVPIWANHYTYNGRKYHCYINGQTGKIVGKAPKSFWKILLLLLGIGGGAIALFSLIKNMFF